MEEHLWTPFVEDVGQTGLPHMWLTVLWQTRILRYSLLHGCLIVRPIDKCASKLYKSLAADPGTMNLVTLPTPKMVTSSPDCVLRVHDPAWRLWCCVPDRP